MNDGIIVGMAIMLLIEFALLILFAMFRGGPK